jgi:ribosomal protein S18 acetylase RimI-like enzyme
MARDFTVRAAVVGDVPFMWDMLWEAAAVSPQVRELGRQAALDLPEVRKYLDGWGRPGDAAVVAAELRSGRRLGAAWYRLFPEDAPGYGWVSSDIPELSIAVLPDARSAGVGGSLLQELKATARAQGYAALSLSVDRGNEAAMTLYRRYGFEDAGISRPSDSSVTMLAKL